MCGIAGVFRPRQPFQIPEGQQLVRRMIGTLVHRGPDADGLWCEPDGRCILGHRRLSIIDTSEAGRQPFISDDGRWIITFNGEIYNFQELNRLSNALAVGFGAVPTPRFCFSPSRYGAFTRLRSSMACLPLLHTTQAPAI
jgi:asparagine synthetase B (glutamine-hydrolysing)